MKKLIQKLNERRQLSSLLMEMWPRYEEIMGELEDLGAVGHVAKFFSDLLIARLAPVQGTKTRAEAEAKKWWQRMSRQDRDLVKQLSQQVDIPGGL